MAHSPAGDGSVSGMGTSSDDGAASTLEQSDFLYIATQIAAGMNIIYILQDNRISKTLI